MDKQGNTVISAKSPVAFQICMLTCCFRAYSFILQGFAHRLPPPSANCGGRHSVCTKPSESLQVGLKDIILAKGISFCLLTMLFSIHIICYLFVPLISYATFKARMMDFIFFGCPSLNWLPLFIYNNTSIGIFRILLVFHEKYQG